MGKEEIKQKKTRSANTSVQVNIDTDKVSSIINVNIKCKTEKQKHLLNSIRDNEITIISGLAGSGKTFLSCSEALRLLKTNEKYKRIILIKSITPLKNEDPGHLPGDIRDKMDPIMESFYDNIRKLIGKVSLEKLINGEHIITLPVAFARGRTLDNAIIIIDEAQNISIENIRTLMTRIGENSKMIIMGDVKQKDLRNKNESSLGIIAEKFKNLPNFAVIELYSEDDVVRNPIIKIIERVFDEINDIKK
jgi:phosphate starvation-inducible PhoH-like protein